MTFNLDLETQSLFTVHPLPFLWVPYKPERAGENIWSWQVQNIEYNFDRGDLFKVTLHPFNRNLLLVSCETNWTKATIIKSWQIFYTQVCCDPNLKRVVQVPFLLSCYCHQVRGAINVFMYTDPHHMEQTRLFSEVLVWPVYSMVCMYMYMHIRVYKYWHYSFVSRHMDHF